jgi:thiamine biosynthesis lipoprotein
VELDLGSTGKALAADLGAAAAVAAMGRGGVLLSLGGDIATAGTVPDDGWRVLAADESTTPSDADGEVIAIGGGALATSGTSSRRWTRDGVTLHHLIDPRTGLPADGPWRTASVAAATCVDANIAATAAIVRGRSAVPWLEERGLAARLVSTSGQVVRVAGWPAPFADEATPARVSASSSRKPEDLRLATRSRTRRTTYAGRLEETTR